MKARRVLVLALLTALILALALFIAQRVSADDISPVPLAVQDEHDPNDPDDEYWVVVMQQGGCWAMEPYSWWWFFFGCNLQQQGFVAESETITTTRYADGAMTVAIETRYTNGSTYRNWHALIRRQK